MNANNITTYQLKSPFDFPYKGQIEKCIFIELHEPSGGNEFAINMIQETYQILTKVANETKDLINIDEIAEKQEQINVEKELYETEEQKIAKEEQGYKLLLIGYSNLKLSEMVKQFGQMCCINTKRPIALCNGKERMKHADWENFGLRDQINMFIRWFSFFVMPSVLEDMNNELETQSTYLTSQTAE